MTLTKLAPHKSLSFICSVLVVFLAYFCFVYKGFHFNLNVLSIFFAIGLLSIAGIYFSPQKNTVSLNTSLCLFYFFFFSLAPIIQFKGNVVFQYSHPFQAAVYITSAYYVLSSLLLYFLLYYSGHHFLNKFNFKVKERLSIPISKQLVILYLVSILASVFYLYLLKFKWDLLLFRPFAYDLKSNTNLGLLGYALLSAVKLVPVVVLYRYQFCVNKLTKHSILFLFFVFFCCFPLALPRGVMAIIYIPIFLLFFKKLAFNHSFLLLFIFSFLIIFPFFNSFRYLEQDRFKLSYQLFNTSHFDSFQNFMLLLKYQIVTDGTQLLGDLLFFIPESLWPEKPAPTGFLLAHKLGFTHHNIAIPLIGEAYVNFAEIGILIFVSINAMINIFLEKFQHSDTFLIKYLFYIFLGFEFILLRGDLWNACKILFSFLLAFFIVQITMFFHQIFLKK